MRPDHRLRRANVGERWIFDRLLRQPGDSRFSRLAYGFWERLYRRIVRRGDPIVQKPVAGVPLWMPMSHQLLFNLKHFPRYSTNLGRLARILFEKDSGLRLVDVGANIGDSVAMVRREVPIPILCVEGDDAYFELLTQNMRAIPDIELAQVFVGVTDRSGRWQIHRDHGTASLREEQAPLAVGVRPLDDVLQEHPAFLNAGMIKIDTDGFDGHVLRSAANFLRKTHPVVFIEYDPDLLVRVQDSPDSLREFLRSAGYEWTLIYDNFGELVGSASLSDRRRWEELDAYLHGRQSQWYADLCIFHASKKDLFETAREQELAVRRSIPPSGQWEAA